MDVKLHQTAVLQEDLIPSSWPGLMPDFELQVGINECCLMYKTELSQLSCTCSML